jgi:hypothetical protein
MNKDLEHIAHNNKYTDKIYISFSEFNLFNQCGYKHLIEKHLKITEPTTSVNILFGNAIHYAIEKSLKDSIGLVKRIDIFKRTFAKDMLDHLSGEIGFHKNLKDFLKQGEDLLNTLSIEDFFLKYKIVSVEESIVECIFWKLLL